MKIKTPKPLFVKLLVTLPIITITFWILSVFIVGAHLSKTILEDFKSSNERIVKSIARQSINALIYYDYFELSRTTHDFFNTEYMRYLAIYTQDMKPLAVYPSQLQGEDFVFLEKQLLESKDKDYLELFYKENDKKLFYIQSSIKDDQGNLLGYLVMGGTTKHLDKIVQKQVLSFVLLGFVVLLAQIIAIIYVSHIITKPLRNVTRLISAAEKEEPDDLIDTALAITSPKGASSETTIFLAVYQKLLRRIQEHIKRNKEMAVQAAIGKVASHIAHDMRSPLSVIKATFELDLTKEPDKQLMIRSANQSAFKLDRMADDLLDYAKAHNVERRSSNIAKIANEVIKEVRETAKHECKTIQFSVAGSNDICANIDPHRFNRVLVNILTNAVQAIKHKDGKIEITIGARGSDLEVGVKDNGEGIRPEHIPNLFDSMFTFGKSGGSGLGLTYCKNVIEAHGGNISAESVRGEGATFTVRIPGAITSAPAVEEPEAVVDTGKIISKKRVLVMDDEEEILICWRIMLKEATGRVPIELSVPEKVMETNIDPAKIDIAIVDYEFRGSNMDGLDVLQYLKDKGMTELYLCTAYYQDKDIKERAAKLGVKRIIPKPLPSGILREIL